MRRLPCGEDGFTLVEVLVAVGLLTVGILGAATAVTMQASGGLSGSASTGLAAINRANAASVATMLAQQKVEEVKNAAYPATGTTTEDPVTGFSGYRRTTTIEDGPIATYTRKITVRVFFRYAQETGLGQESAIKLSSIVAQRP